MKKILLSAIVSASVLLTNVQAQSTHIDSIEVQNTFKNSYDLIELKNAFKDAAADKSWVLTNEDANKLTFTKSFSERKKYSNHAAHRPQQHTHIFPRKTISETVTLDVKVSQNSFTMNLGVKDKNSRIAEKAQSCVQELQNSFYANVAASKL
ncbi:hypothetical protein [Sulfurimonas sp. C5]|uniref:hypothetical protein n=1 Tax=Sulfurimonas sp. C5 TaxID=3036947 RepID=UPI0024542BA0|nr:hypothetical protein [Sulfurimonas sp. C5]MDH4945399.1 hypothetical protein [Sulfurimonas sp. C5]